MYLLQKIFWPFLTRIIIMRDLIALIYNAKAARTTRVARTARTAIVTTVAKAPTATFFSKTMLLIALLLSFLAFLTSSSSATALEAKDIVAAVRKVEDQIEDSIQKKRIPGCAVAIVYKKHIIFINGYGVRSIGKDDKIDLDTVFQLGSVSKPIAATLAAVLEEKGKLNLDSPVSQYLPGFTLYNQPEDSLKVNNVLSHTSGVPRSGFNHLIETFTPYPDIMATLQKTRVVTQPGIKYDYHNAMYGLISEIVEAATHQTFEDALKTYLLNPLHMHHTSATFEGLFIGFNTACPHTRGKGGLVPCEPYSRGYYTVAPAGGINSSIHDMAIFLNAQLGAYPKVISAKVLEKTQTPMVATHSLLSGGRSKNPSYGLGWRIIDYADQKLVYHAGWVKGFTNFIAFMPDQELGIVVLHNADTRFTTPLVIKFFETALGLPEIKEAAKPYKKYSNKKKSKSKPSKKIKSKTKKKKKK